MVKYQIFAQAISCVQEASTEQELDGDNRWYGYWYSPPIRPIENPYHGWGRYRGGKCKDKYDEKKCIKMKENGKCEDKKVVKKCMKTCEKCEDHGGEGKIFFVNWTKIFFCKC